MKTKIAFFLSLFCAGVLPAAFTTVRTLTATTAHGYSVTAQIQAQGNIWQVVAIATDAPANSDTPLQTGSWNVSVNGVGIGDYLTAAQSPSTVGVGDGLEFSEGDELVLEVESLHQSADSVFSERKNAAVYSTMPAPGPSGTANSVTFSIPYNGTIYTKHYVAYQNDLAVAFFTHAAGAAATSFVVGPLPLAAPVTLFLITGGSVGDDGTDTPVITPLTELTGVNTGTPVAGGVTVNNTSNPPTTKPVNETPSTPTVTTTGGGITLTPPTTPTGTTAANKTDIMTMGNQVTAAIQAADTRATAGANLTATAINGVITAQNKTVAALDRLNAKSSGTDMTATNNLLGTGNTNTAAIKTAAETLVTNDAARKIWDDARKAEATAAAAGGQASGTNAQGTAVTTMTGVIPVHSFQDASPGAPNFFQITIPGRGAVGGNDILNLNPFDSPDTSGVATFIKAVAAVLVSGFFTWWAYGHLAQYVMFSSLLQPAKGNTVAGSGGQVTSALVAAWMTLVLLTLPTAISALWTAAPLLPSGSAINPFAGGTDSYSQGALYLLYGFLPMVTITTALTSMFVVQRGGLIVYFGTAAAVRWFIA